MGKGVLIVVGVLAALTLPVAPAAAAPKTVWLCKPGKKRNPCAPRLTATVLSPSGGRRGVERRRRARRPRFDCFYVYPTVSDQPTPIANLRIDPQQRGVARFQAGRFSRYCRVFAPMYRQLTLAGLFGAARLTPEQSRAGYEDVRAAWRRYLRRHNRGRGVVLIGHSQGTVLLKRLLDREIEPRRRARRRLISALLIGWNVEVARRRDRGGDFERLRACRSRRQIGCIVAYSTFGETPPAGSVFGRVPASASATREVLCTNPARLAGRDLKLDSYYPTSPFPGTIGASIRLSTGGLPSASTPWVKYSGAYRARCSRAGGANVLRVTPLAGARVLRPVPTPGWGLHLADVNIALGELTGLARRKARVYLKRRR